MSETVREKLGAYMSIECFRYLRFGAEDTAGRALIVNAGKQRGHSLKDMLKEVSLQDEKKVEQVLGEILGLKGTRLCLVQSAKRTANGYTFTIDESACCSGTQAPEPVCAYTLGVFIGALESMSGKRVMGQEVECKATNNPFCVYQLEYLN
jgi:predicted hydrocarbon binding protein